MSTYKHTYPTTTTYIPYYYNIHTLLLQHTYPTTTTYIPYYYNIAWSVVTSPDIRYATNRHSDDVIAEHGH